MTKNKPTKTIQDFILGKRNLEDTVNKLSNQLEKLIIKECERAIKMKETQTALIVVDMQNDFITGALGSLEAEAIIEPAANYIKNFQGCLIYETRDFHKVEDYRDSVEGRRIPIHCVLDKKGYDTEERISDAIRGKRAKVDHYVFMKNTFGSIDFAQSVARDVKNLEIEKIVLIGLCTDICVISNALMLRAACPNTRIVVLEDLCAGSNPENHYAALRVLRANCIDVEKAF